MISKHIEHIRLLANKNIDLLVFNDSHQKPLLALAFENDDYNTTAVLLELNANPNTAIKVSAESATGLKVDMALERTVDKLCHRIQLYQSCTMFG